MSITAINQGIGISPTLPYEHTHKVGVASLTWLSTVYTYFQLVLLSLSSYSLTKQRVATTTTKRGGSVVAVLHRHFGIFGFHNNIATIVAVVCLSYACHYNHPFGQYPFGDNLKRFGVEVECE